MFWLFYLLPSWFSPFHSNLEGFESCLSSSLLTILSWSDLKRSFFFKFSCSQSLQLSTTLDLSLLSYINPLTSLCPWENFCVFPLLHHYLHHSPFSIPFWTYQLFKAQFKTHCLEEVSQIISALKRSVFSQTLPLALIKVGFCQTSFLLLIIRVWREGISP